MAFLDKIILKVCLQHDVSLKPPSKAKTQVKILDKFIINDDDFREKLKTNLEENKNATDTFWPTKVWKSRFMQRFNLSYKANKTHTLERVYCATCSIAGNGVHEKK